MDSIRVFCDSIKNVVNVPCKCAEAKSDCPTNWENVVIVGIIAVASVVIIGVVCWTVYCIINKKKQEGLKKIIKEDKDIKNMICQLIKENSEIKVVMCEQIKDVDPLKDAIRDVVKDEMKKHSND